MQNQMKIAEEKLIMVSTLDLITRFQCNQHFVIKEEAPDLKNFTFHIRQTGVGPDLASEQGFSYKNEDVLLWLDMFTTKGWLTMTYRDLLTGDLCLLIYWAVKDDKMILKGIMTLSPGDYIEYPTSDELSDFLIKYGALPELSKNILKDPVEMLSLDILLRNRKSFDKIKDDRLAG